MTTMRGGYGDAGAQGAHNMLALWQVSGYEFVSAKATEARKARPFQCIVKLASDKQQHDVAAATTAPMRKARICNPPVGEVMRLLRYQLK